MTIIIRLPALSPTMTDGKIAKWLKKEGEAVKQGTAIAEIETDKATMEVEASEDGTLAKILIKEGAEGVKVATAIAVILEAGEGEAELKATMDKINQPVSSSASTNPVASATPAISPTPAIQANVAAASTKDGNRIFASPLAKRIAAGLNISLNSIKGSGPNGRILKHDVESFSSNKSTSHATSSESIGEFKEIPHSMMRKTIAKRLLESKQNSPHFYLAVDYNLDELLKARTIINSAAKDAYKISVNDFIIKASALALRDFPDVNAYWTPNAMHQLKQIDISIAVATKTGLITPIIRNADKKGLIEISNEMKSLAKKAHDGTLLPEEYQGGGFTISNLGMYSVTQFAPIINPPQASIIGVGTGIEKPVVENGAIKISTIMTITIAADHRVIDGVKAAEFMNALKKYIENPINMSL